MNAENSTPPYGFRRVAGERVETQAKPGVASSRGTDTAIAQTPEAWAAAQSTARFALAGGGSRQ